MQLSSLADPQETWTVILTKNVTRRLIDSATFKSAKGRTRGSMKCEVKRFELGTDLTIKDWIN